MIGFEGNTVFGEGAGDEGLESFGLDESDKDTKNTPKKLDFVG